MLMALVLVLIHDKNLMIATDLQLQIVEKYILKSIFLHTRWYQIHITILIAKEISINFISFLTRYFQHAFISALVYYCGLSCFTSSRSQKSGFQKDPLCHTTPLKLPKDIQSTQRINMVSFSSISPSRSAPRVFLHHLRKERAQTQCRHWMTRDSLKVNVTGD